MHKTVTLAAAAISALTLGLAPGATAQAQAGNIITLRVCNNTNSVAQVAVSYKPLGSNTFSNEGWFNVDPGQCEDLGETTNAYMYGYAEVDGSDTEVWQGSHPRCVEFPGPYEFWDTGSVYCEAHQEVRNFETLHAREWGVFTWNLDS